LVDFLTTAAILKPYLDGYGTYKTAIKEGANIIKTIKNLLPVKQRDIYEIFRDVKNGKIAINETVETYGLLLEYGQIFQPYTHIKSMFGQCKKGDNEKQLYKDGKIITQASMTVKSTTFQLPVQKIPSYDNMGCAFLYDNMFKGFIHERSKENGSFIIDDNAKPIMVLYDTQKYKKNINKDVIVKAKVIELPNELISQINGNFDDDIRNICSNFIDPYSDNTNFICLAVIDDNTSIKSALESEIINTLEVPLYVECELENYNLLCGNNKNTMTNLLSEIVPNLPQRVDACFPINIMNVANNVGNAFISTGDIYTVFREPNIIGFYTTTTPFNNEIYSKTLMEYSEIVTNFSVDYKNLTKKHFKKKENMCLNFLFDFSKQGIFDSRGVLYSKSANDSVRDDEPKKYIQEWLKNDRYSI
jgi:hypothetical protein